MLLWSVLHLTGTRAANADYERLGAPSVTLDDIRHFRQLDSKALGHPKYHWVSGVETTTGPPGQGIATSVGMAIARKWLASHYNKPSFDVFDYDIYTVCGDGCLMEGVGSEAASLVGHLGLDDLCWIYDNNHIKIEGNTRIAFTEDVATRFLAYGWNVLSVGDTNEVVEAYRYVLQLRHQPAVIALSRRPLPTFDRRKYASAAGVARGGYVMADAPGGPPEIILMGSGSEVSLIVEAHEALAVQGIRFRVVSMPSWDIFEHQPQSYRESALPAEISTRIAVEQGSALGWDRYVGATGLVIGMETLGASAPFKELQRKLGSSPSGSSISRGRCWEASNDARERRGCGCGRRRDGGAALRHGDLRRRR